MTNCRGLLFTLQKERNNNNCNLLSPTHTNTIYGINSTCTIIKGNSSKYSIAFNKITCTIIKSNNSKYNITYYMIIYL